MLVLVAASLAVAAVGPAASCAGDIRQSQLLISRDYPGYREKMRTRGRIIADARSAMLGKAARITDNKACDPLLFGFLRSFGDGHIFFFRLRCRHR